MYSARVKISDLMALRYGLPTSLDEDPSEQKRASGPASRRSGSDGSNSESIVDRLFMKNYKKYGTRTFPTTTEGAVEFYKEIGQEHQKAFGIGALPTTRYEKWLRHKQNLEEEIQTFEVREAQFPLRWTDQNGDMPSTAEIKKYEIEKAINDKRRRELKAVIGKVKQSFDLASLPKTVDDAMAILKKMAPSHSIFIKPKELRDALALSAPGGVVDEVEVNKDVVMIKERLLRVKKKALEERKTKEKIVNEDQKATKGGKNQDHGKKQGVKGGKGDVEAKNGNVETKTESIPGDDLWYSTLFFPQLAQELVDISKVLEENLGTKGALSALNTALMEEALAVDKACDLINFKVCQAFVEEPNEKTPKQLEQVVTYLRACDEAAVALGDVAAVLRVASYYSSWAEQPEKAIKILKDAIEAGIADAAVYKTLGDHYFESKNQEANGIEAEKCYRIASEFQPTKAGEADTVVDAQIGRVRIYALGCHPIPADPFYAAYLMSKVHTTRDKLEPITLARINRFTFWGLYDEKEAVRYYRYLVEEDSKACNFEILKEAARYVNAKVKGVLDEAQFNAEEHEIRLDMMLTSARLHPGIPGTYAHIADHYMPKSGRNMDMKKAKAYLDKALQYVPSKDPSSDVRVYCALARYYLLMRDLKKILEYLAKAEAMFDSVPLDVRRKYITTAHDVYTDYIQDDIKQLDICNKAIKDGFVSAWIEKASIIEENLNNPEFKDCQSVYHCYSQAEKYISKDSEVDKSYLKMACLRLAAMFMPDSPRPSEEENKGVKYVPPADREKARYYLQKCMVLGARNAWKSIGKTYFSKLTPWNSGKDDEEKAAKCYTKSLVVNKDDPEVLFELGYLLLHGRGIKQDRKKAQHHYQRALALGGEKFKAIISKYSNEFQL